MDHLSLFNGIGGFQLSAYWVGWNNVAHVEIDEWCNKIVAQHFPNSKCYTDIKDFNGKEYEGAIDIISGGFPCQPFSTAGKRKGEEDSRNLWPEYLRIIQEIKPAYVIGENVAGLLSMEDGRTLEGIFTDLESEGYTVEPFIIPACSIGAWHRRDRVWIVGYTNAGFSEQQKGKIQARGNPSDSGGKIITNTKSSESQSPMHSRKWGRGTSNYNLSTGGEKTSSDNKSIGIQERRASRKQEPQAPIRKGLFGCDSARDGASYWSSEPGMGRMVTRISRRVDRIKGLGNAIVPQVAFEIFKVINKHYENS